METIVVDLALPAAGIERCIKEAGIAFMFAPNFYPTMKHIVTVRKAPAARQQRCLGGPTARYPGLLGRSPQSPGCTRARGERLGRRGPNERLWCGRDAARPMSPMLRC